MKRINSPTAKSKPTFLANPKPLDISLDLSLILPSFLANSFIISYDSSSPRSSMQIISISFKVWFKRLSRQSEIYLELLKIGSITEILVLFLKFSIK